MKPEDVKAELVEKVLETRLPSGGLPPLNEPQVRTILAAAWPLIASLVLADMAAEPAETWHRDALRARALLWLDGEGPDQPAGEARLTDAGWVRETTEVRAVSHGGHLDLYGPPRPDTPETMPACPQDGRADVSADSGACGGGCEAAGALDALDGGTNENGEN